MRRFMWSLGACCLVSASGCGILGCEQETRVIEIRWGSITEDLDRLALELAEDDGLDCRSDGALRNASGAEIGERWVCEKC